MKRSVNVWNATVVIATVIMIMWNAIGIRYVNGIGNYSVSYVVDWNAVPTTAPAVANTLTSSFGSCVCDLTENQCDANCCCDPDCSATLVANTFTTCVNPLTKKDINYLCVAKSLVTISNLATLGISTKDVTLAAGTPLFCVYFSGSKYNNNVICFN